MALVSPSGEALSTVFSVDDVTVRITAAELAAGEMSPEHVQRVCSFMREFGVVLVNCDERPIVPFEDLDMMGARLDYQAALSAAKGTLLANGTAQRGNGGTPGIQFTSLPRRARWVRASVLCNPIIEQAVAAILGPGCFLNLWAPLTNAPGSGVQDLHMDGTWWKTTAEEAAAVNHPWPYHTHTVNATCGCDDLTHSNGATELWPGSHWETDGPPQTNKPRDPEEHQRVLRECAAKRRLHFPPIQVCAPKGAVYFRDDRVWHRGVSNTSDKPRHIIQMAYRAAEVRADVTHGSTILRNRSTAAERAASKSDTHWVDTFERFH
eukprot:COSAG06_NODE_16500_length_997_cov_2.408686_1_plen_321_part_10